MLVESVECAREAVSVVVAQYIQIEKSLMRLCWCFTPVAVDSWLTAVLRDEQCCDSSMCVGCVSRMLCVVCTVFSVYNNVEVYARVACVTLDG